MPVLRRYVGGLEEVEIAGQKFARGEWVEIKDPKILHKVKYKTEWERANVAEGEEPKAIKTDRVDVAERVEVHSPMPDEPDELAAAVFDEAPAPKKRGRPRKAKG